MTVNDDKCGTLDITRYLDTEFRKGIAQHVPHILEAIFVPAEYVLWEINALMFDCLLVTHHPFEMPMVLSVVSHGTEGSRNSLVKRILMNIILERNHYIMR